MPSMKGFYFSQLYPLDQCTNLVWADKKKKKKEKKGGENINRGEGGSTVTIAVSSELLPVDLRPSDTPK